MLDFTVIVLAACILYGVRVQSKAKSNNDYLSKESTNSLRAIFALTVVMHHLAQRAEGGLLFRCFGLIGNLAVGVFFFISGYGLMKQHQINTEYMRGFLLHRLPSVLVPYLVVSVPYFIVYNLTGKAYTVQKALFGLADGSLVANSWYVVAIVVFYLIFHFAIKAGGKNKYAVMAIIALGEIAYSICCYALGYGSWYYNSCLCFFLGIVWCMYQDQLENFFRNGYGWKLAGTFLLFCIFFFIQYFTRKNYSGDILSALLILAGLELSCTFFSIFVVLLGHKVQFGNRLLRMVRGASYEIYLIHGLVYYLLRNSLWSVKSDFLWVSLTLVLSVLSGYLLHKAFAVFMMKYRSMQQGKILKV